MVVKDGHYDQFEKALKAHLKHRAKNGDSRVWKTYTPIIGDDLNHFIVRYCCVSYADMDDYQKWSNKEKMNDHWNETVDPHIANYQHYFMRIDSENSNWPEDDSMYKMFGVTSWSEKQGHGAAIAKSKKALSDAAKKDNWPRYWSWSDRVGGDGGLTLVTPYKNYADMESPDGGFGAFLARHVGEEAAGEMLSGFSDNFDGSQYSVYRLVDELSMKD